MGDPDELTWLRNGTLAPSIAARVNALLQRAETETVAVRSAGPNVPWEQRSQALRDDLREGRVVSVEGGVRYDEPGSDRDASRLQWAFEGQAPAWLCFDDHVCARPLPGSWRLHVLPRSALVVGAEHAPHDDPLERYRARLLAVQKLGAEDLAALRQGRTCAFVQATISRGIRMSWILVGAGLLAGVMGAGAWFMVATISPQQTIDIGGLPVAWPVIFMLFPIVFPAVALQQARVLRRERTAPIERIEGPINRGWRGSKRQSMWIEIAGVDYRGQDEPVLRDLFHHLIPGTPVRAYVTAKRRLVVGVEPLPAPDAANPNAASYR